MTIPKYVPLSKVCKHTIQNNRKGKREKGLETALQLLPNLIISDVMMPEMDGYTLCHHLKTDERTSHIPIILLTTKASVENHVSGLQMGADAYLTKPFSVQVLALQV